MRKVIELSVEHRAVYGRSMSNVTLDRFAEQDPNAVAVIAADGVEWTRGRLAALVHRLARALRGAGLREGEVLALVAPNSAEYVAAYLAGIEAGLYVAPVNWHLADGELAVLLRDAGARAVVAHPGLGAQRLSALAECAPPGALLICTGEAPGYLPLHDFCAGYSAAPAGPAAWGRMMPFTSATTGRAKAVKLPLGNARAALAHFVSWHEALGAGPGGGHVHLCASMLYHSAPLLGAVGAVHMGHRLVLVDRWEPMRLLELIEHHRVTTTFMVPAMFVRLLKLPAEVRGRYDVSSLLFVLHGGAPCPVAVKRAMLDWWGPVLWESYGAAEGQGTIVGPAEWLARPGTVGRPAPGSRVRILDDEGTELPAGRTGTIYLLPYNGDRFEYVGDPAETARRYRGDLITAGDLGYVDEEGYLFIRGREGDLIISSGMNIYAAEIEQALLLHPAVADCAVIGAPHELLGEVPHAFVELERGIAGTRELAGHVLSFVGERLSAMKLPKRIHYVERIPRDPSGKLLKRLLAALPASTAEAASAAGTP